MSNERSGFLPRTMLISGLSISAKCVYVEMTANMEPDGTVSINKNQLAKNLDRTVKSVSDGIKKLIEADYITEVNIDDIVHHLKNNGLNGLGVGVYKCSWCGIKTNVIDKHHYPIPRSEGGTEVIEICPNCHAEYHRCESSYVINEDDGTIAWMYETSFKNSFGIKVSESAYEK